MTFLKRIFGQHPHRDKWRQRYGRYDAVVDQHPHRDKWCQRYGRYASVVDTVWLDRDLEHNKKQALRDASQNVMTRLV